MSKRTKVMVVDGVTFEYLCGQHCMWAHVPPALITAEPLKLPDGRQVEYGAHVTRMGGKKTSAGYVNIEMLPGKILRYLGMAYTLDGVFVVMDAHHGHSAFDKKPKPELCIWHWFPDKGPLSFTTQACAMRMIELTGWEFDNKPDPGPDPRKSCTACMGHGCVRTVRSRGTQYPVYRHEIFPEKETGWPCQYC